LDNRVGEPDASRSKAVHIRCLGPGFTVASDRVGPAIVHHNPQYVRAFGFPCGGLRMCTNKTRAGGKRQGYAGSDEVPSIHLFHKTALSTEPIMSSAKLQVRPILLKKISFMIFFNNYLSDYETIRCHRKEKISPEQSRRNDFFFSK
jgi:hypothetical protein